MAITQAYDATGKPLSVGDKVLIPATIVTISQGTYTADISTTTKYSSSPSSESYTTVAVNSRQVFKDE